jgi:hypothetical protein
MFRRGLARTRTSAGLLIRLDWQGNFVNVVHLGYFEKDR